MDDEYILSDAPSHLTTSETIELLECLKSWSRLGIYTEVDLHTIVTALGDDEGLEM